MGGASLVVYHLVAILLRAGSLPSEVSFLTDKIESPREFPGGPVVRTWCFHCCGLGSMPGQGTEILQATWHGQKKKEVI